MIDLWMRNLKGNRTKLLWFVCRQHPDVWLEGLRECTEILPGMNAQYIQYNA
jgi:hypothetical protein